ncbi:response regulator [Marinomonas sp. C2222]|uniref:Response regulator n=1 Tax=Marinomonas sargassi TaxID=2984494 RepID=A0ABT2YSP2_9GAMM|nr:tetratricopeptide repeat-containing response regulator [Marinomonas sargassi]MCV2402895.1 response regulator [Marinomonas sargassi]
MTSQDFSKKKALLIEDMAEARIMQKKMLTDFGFTAIDIAMKAETAIDLLKSKSYDVVFSDYNLGKGKDGQQLLEEVRRSELIKNTSAYLMVTAETSVEMVMGAIEFQPDGYITKPFSQVVLHRRLSKLIEMKERLLEVNKALDAKKYEKAIEEAQKTIEKHPSLTGKCERIIGDCYLELKDYDNALRVFKETLASRKMPWALFGKAKTYFFLDKLDKAEQNFRQLMLDNRFFVSAYDWLAKIQLSQNKPEEAQSTILEAIEKSPKNLLRQVELGKVSLLIKDYITAESAYRRAAFLAKHSCFDIDEIYLCHLDSIVHLASEGPLSSRHRDSFNRTLKNVHEISIDNPSHRARAYQCELELALNESNLTKAKTVFETWKNETEKGSASAPTEQQSATYLQAFGE